MNPLQVEMVEMVLREQHIEGEKKRYEQIRLRLKDQDVESSEYDSIEVHNDKL